jgi:nitric oxide synthase-interacting protein
MKEFEKQKDSDEKELQRIAEADNDRKIDIFKKTEKSIKIPSTSTSSSSSSSSLSNMSGAHAKLNPSFWLPNQTPDSGKARIQKPDKTIYCPISGNVLKSKDLIDVKFTKGNRDEGSSKDPNEPQYVCAVTKDVLTNSQQLAVLRTTGDVVTMDCVEKIIKKDWIHPLTSQKITEKDIIVLQRGGTGFASANKLEAKTSRPALQC